MLTYEITESKMKDVKSLDWEESVFTPIEGIIGNFGLEIAQKTTLSSKTGSVHWHLKKGKESGVLEVTVWPKKHQLWIEIHNNRRNEWNLNQIGLFSEALAELFQGKVIVKDS